MTVASRLFRVGHATARQRRLDDRRRTRQVVLDLDATPVTAQSDEKATAQTWKGPARSGSEHLRRPDTRGRMAVRTRTATYEATQHAADTGMDFVHAGHPG